MDCRDALRTTLGRIPRLLLIRLRSLGDSILTLPLFEALHHHHPGLQLDVLIEAPFAPVFAGHPAVGEILTLRPRAGGGGWGRARAAFEIARRRYPVAVNLHGGTTSLALTLASAAPLRVGLEGYRNARAYSVRVPASSAVWGRAALHTVEHQLAIVRWLGLDVGREERLQLPVSERARATVQARLAAASVDPARYIVIHPTATLETKQWAGENFAALADQLAEWYRTAIVFTAGSAEQRALDSVRGNARGGHLYWSELELEELFALIEGCRLFVGNDSGPMHAAAALGRPVVAVWGSSNAAAWRPWGTDYELVGSDLPCMPCPGYTCREFGRPRCILEIGVDRVMAACSRLLARHPV